MSLIEYRILLVIRSGFNVGGWRKQTSTFSVKHTYFFQEKLEAEKQMLTTERQILETKGKQVAQLLKQVTDL